MSCQQRNVPNAYSMFYVLIILPMKKVMIECKRCQKIIEKKGNREYCIACSNKRDKEIAKIYREAHKEEIRTKNRERARLEREALKRDQ